MPTQKFWVKGLRSEDETQVEGAVRALAGVLFAAANHQAQCTEVEFEDDEVTPQEIGQAIESLGYRVELAG